MKKISYILIPIIALSIFLAPISPVFQKQDGNLAAKIEVNKTLAQNSASPITISAEETLKNSSLKWKNSTESDASFLITIEGDQKSWNNVNFFVSTLLDETDFAMPNGIILVISEKGVYKNHLDLTPFIWNEVQDKRGITNPVGRIDYYPPLSLITEKKIGSLDPNTEYTGQLYFLPNSNNLNNSSAIQVIPLAAAKYYKFGNSETFKTAKTGETIGDISAPQQDIIKRQLPYDLGCSDLTDFTISGCLAQLSYSFWEISAFVARGAASFLDFFVYYSTNSNSYTSIFITKAWSAIRDIANIFFIIALIYIAIKTILSLGGVGSKKLIGYIILFALLINFSLFTTQVIIDGSNILAKVFYNQIESKGPNGQPLDPGAGGQKSISIGLIRGFNPQEIIIEQNYPIVGAGMFIFITLMLTAITLYTAYAFFVVAILFVGRVVSLWIAMIFAPLAFASYTVPFDIPGFGHKKWWSDLFQAAFLAPIFIFFLYIIVLFVEFGSSAVIYATNDPDFMQVLMKTIIPFAIIFMLLMKAKKLAVEYSGELGAALTKMGGTALGFAGGVVMGGAAMLGTGVIGGAASRLAGSERLEEATKKKGLGGWAARLAMRTATMGTKATFDIRKTAVGGAMARGMGVDFQRSAALLGLGAKAGGFKGITERRAKRMEEEAENTKTRMTNEEVKAWSAKRVYDYDAKRNEAIKNAGGIDKFNEEEFKKTNGERPKLYETAEALNNDRMKTYAENIGKTGLIYSLAHSFTRAAMPVSADDVKKAENRYKEERSKEKEEAEKRQGITFNADQEELFNRAYEAKHGKVPTMESLLEERTRQAKMLIGGAATLATLGIGGFGAPVIAGVAAAGTAVGIEELKKTEADRLARAAFAKQIAQLGKVEEEIEKMTKVLVDQKRVATRMAELEKDKLEADRILKVKRDLNNKPILDKDGNVTIVDVDNVKLNRAMAEKEVENRGLQSQLDSINKRIAEQGTNKALEMEKNRIQAKMVEVTVEKEELNSLKTIKEKVANTERQIFNLGRSKAAIQKETVGKKEGKVEGKPSAPPPPPPPPPAK